MLSYLSECGPDFKLRNQRDIGNGTEQPPVSEAPRQKRLTPCSTISTARQLRFSCLRIGIYPSSILMSGSESGQAEHRQAACTVQKGAHRARRLATWIIATAARSAIRSSFSRSRLCPYHGWAVNRKAFYTCFSNDHCFVYFSPFNLLAFTGRRSSAI